MSCKPRMIAKCDEGIIQSSSPSVECPAWEVCLPFGASLVSKGGCVNYFAGTNIPADGVYSKIVIQDGCIAGVELADIPIYTSPPCAPIPTSCSGGTSALPDPSPTVGNIFQYDANGRPLVKLSVQSGPGINVTGNATNSSPLVITNTQPTAQAIQIKASTSAIKVTGAGTTENPFNIAHALAAISGVQGPYVFDEFGHISGYNPSSTSMYITGIVEGDGISVQTNPSTGVATVALAEPVTVISDNYQFGAYDVEFYRNRLIRINRIIRFPAGVYKLGDYNVQIDEYGSVVGITPLVPENVHWSKLYATTGDNERSLVITLGRATALRIQYTGVIPADLALTVDGATIAGVSAPLVQRYDALPVALYGVGQHTITFRSASFTGSGFIDVSITA